MHGHTGEMMYKFSAVINKEKNMYVSWCPELDVASQGKTIEEAIANLKEAVELYLEDEDAKLPNIPPYNQLRQAGLRRKEFLQLIK